MPVTFFNRSLDDFMKQYPPCTSKDLHLMLWAGDGKHDDLTDVQRLSGYHVYLCAGSHKYLQENIDALADDQTLCILDVENESQLALFHQVYDGCFAKIDSDYYGNTPSLSLADYIGLLQGGGIARHVESINGMIMPYENLYGVLEIFAPILPDELLLKRRWCVDVMNLSKREDLHPAMLWASPDLQHPYYAYVKQNQNSFEAQQKRRAAAWPHRETTLFDHWSTLSTALLISPIELSTIPEGANIIKEVTPHMTQFSEFLSYKIESLIAAKRHFTLNRLDYSNELDILDYDILRVVRLKQSVLTMLMIGIPYGLTATIGWYDDTRLPEKPMEFGLTVTRVSGSASTFLR